MIIGTQDNQTAAPAANQEAGSSAGFGSNVPSVPSSFVTESGGDSVSIEGN